MEHKELKETESRVEKILNHQINLEKLMDEMSRDMVNKSGVIAALQNLRIRMEYNAVFQTKKVKNKKDQMSGGGGRELLLGSPPGDESRPPGEYCKINM